MKRALVISGGGSKGAFGGGIAQYLVRDMGHNYDLLVGTSTGSLLTSMIACNEFEILKEAYTSVTPEDIFKVNPFRIKNNHDGTAKIYINYWNIFKNVVLRGKLTLGDSSNLRMLINKFLTEDIHKTILDLNKDIYVCTVNINSGKAEFKLNRDYEWKDFCDWIYASSCAPPFMSLVEKDGYQYTDGGVLDYAPIKKAIECGAKEIDAIILKTEEGDFSKEKVTNTFHFLSRLIDLLINEISRDDIQIGKLEAIDWEVKLNIYYTPRVLTNNALIFDKEIMKEWWDEGYEYAAQKNHKSYIIRKDKKPKLISMKGEW